MRHCHHHGFDHAVPSEITPRAVYEHHLAELRALMTKGAGRR